MHLPAKIGDGKGTSGIAIDIFTTNVRRRFNEFQMILFQEVPVMTTEGKAMYYSL